MFLPNLKSVASPVPEIIAIGVFGGVANPGLWEGEAVGGREWYRLILKERWSSMVTFPLSLRVSEILPLLCSCTPLFLTPPIAYSLTQISPCSLGVGGWNCMRFGGPITRFGVVLQYRRPLTLVPTALRECKVKKIKKEDEYSSHVVIIFGKKINKYILKHISNCNTSIGT